MLYASLKIIIIAILTFNVPKFTHYMAHTRTHNVPIGSVTDVENRVQEM